MTPNALTSFIADVDGLADDPHAIGERLAGLLAEDGLARAGAPRT